MKVILCLVVTALTAGQLGAQPTGCSPCWRRASGSPRGSLPPSGNWSEIDTNDERVQEMANFAAKKLGFLRIVGVTKAEVQVRLILFRCFICLIVSNLEKYFKLEFYVFIGFQYKR